MAIATDDLFDQAELFDQKMRVFKENKRIFTSLKQQEQAKPPRTNEIQRPTPVFLRILGDAISNSFVSLSRAPRQRDPLVLRSAEVLGNLTMDCDAIVHGLHVDVYQALQDSIAETPFTTEVFVWRRHQDAGVLDLACALVADDGDMVGRVMALNRQGVDRLRAEMVRCVQNRLQPQESQLGRQQLKGAVSAGVEEHILESLDGRVDSISDDIAHVTFRDTRGVVSHAEIAVEELEGAGIGDGDHLRCVVARRGSETVLRLVPSGRKPLTEEERNAILQRLEKALPDSMFRDSEP